MARAHRAGGDAARRAEEVVEGHAGTRRAGRAAAARRGVRRGDRGAGARRPRARRAAGPDPEPARSHRRRRHGRGRRRAGPDLGRAAEVRLRAPRCPGPGLVPRMDRHGQGGAAVGLPVRLPDRGRGAGRDGAVPVRHRHPGRQGFPAGAAAGPGQRAVHVRDRLPADRGVQPLPPGKGRPVPDRHLGGRAGRDSRRGAAGGGPAARPVRGVHHELPARGRGGRQGHQGHVPGAPVRQGRDVRLLRPGAVRASSTSGCSRTRRRSSRPSACPTG